MSLNKYLSTTGMNSNNGISVMIVATMMVWWKRCSGVATLSRSDTLNIDAWIVAKATSRAQFIGLCRSVKLGHNENLSARF